MSFDPGSAISGAISGYFATGGGYQGIAGAIAGFFVGGFAGGDAKRSARNKARDAYNAAQKDRAQMIQAATAPHNIVYGEALTSGPLAYAETSAGTGTYLHLVVLLAAHEVDAIGEVYLGDEPVGPLDADGFSRSDSTFWRHATSSVSESGTGTTITLSHTPTRIISVATDGYGAFEGAWGQLLGYTVDDNVVTPIPALPGEIKYVTYEYDSGTPLVRIKKHLGSPDQAADATLIAEGSGTWLEANRLRGIAYLYLRLQYDQDIFGAIGIPNVRAVVRGRKVFDPRTGTTAWSDNAALCTADYLRTYMQADADEVPAAEVAAAADVCDQLVTVKLDGITERRYTANGVLSTEVPCKDNLDALTEAMAGAAPYVQGRFLIRAGAHLSPALTITEDMLADGGVDIPQTATPRADLMNRVVAKYVEPANTYTTVEAAPVTNATYVAADGGQDLPLDITYDLCTGQLRAQRLAKIALERARQGMRVILTCSLRAYDVAPTDVVAVSLARYGWAGKLFEVESRSLDLASNTIKLALRETAADVWAWNFGEATMVDLAPNTTLTSPFERPNALTGIAIASGTPHLAIGADGTIVTRGYITWTQSDSIWVVQGGKVEIESIYADQDAATQWQRHPEADGSATSAYIGPLTDGRPTLVRLRPRTAAAKRGPWTTLAFVPTGKTEPPANVTGAAATQVTGGVRIAWSKPADLDYAATEWRLGADFATGPRLFRGSATDFVWLAPPQGAHILRAVHWDTSGNASATPAALSVTVDANGLVQWTDINGRPADYLIRNNLMDASWWAPGVDPFSRSWPANGNGVETVTDYFERQPTFDGGMDTVWVAAKNGGAFDSPAGGWNPGGDGNAFVVDPTKTYRFIVAMKRWGGEGSTWWGPEYNTVCDLNTDGVQWLPYFVPGFGLPLDGHWYLCVGYVFPHIGVGGTAWTHDGAGVYRLSDGVKVVGGQNYNWVATTVSSGTRAYQFYTATPNSGIFIGKPSVTVCDGSETPLNAILASGQAAAAAAAAVNAQDSANAANAELTSIASDDVLTRGEKSRVILDWVAIADEQDGINTQAAAYGITTQRTDYNNARAALSAYLGSLSPAWDNTDFDTPMSGATFRARFAELYYRRQLVLDAIAAAAGQRASWAGVAGRPSSWRAVSRGSNDTAAPAGAGLYNGDSGAYLGGAGRSYTLSVISRSSPGTIAFQRCYDVIGVGETNGYTAAHLAADLNALGADSIIVINTDDEPMGHRFDSGLADAMYRCGASQAIFGSPEFKYRSAYTLVAVAGCGEGGGFEAYQGEADSSTNAWCDVSFLITASGQLVVGGTSATPRTLRDYSYTGDLAATRNLYYSQSSDPGAVPDGALWKDTSATPAVIRMRVAGAWVAASNLTTGQLAMLDSVGTAQLQDNAVTDLLQAYDAGPISVANYTEPDAGTNSTLLTEVSYTADADCEITVIATGTFNWLNTISPTGGGLRRDFLRSTGSPSPNRTAQIYSHTSATGDGMGRAVVTGTMVETFLLSSGASTTIQHRSGQYNETGRTLSVSDVSLVVQVRKK